MVRFSLLALIGASALFSLASGAPITAVFKLLCRDDSLHNGTAIVELWDQHIFGADTLITRMGDVIMDGKAEYTITGDAHNWFFQTDHYYLKIVHKCYSTCPTSTWSYFPFWYSITENEWTVTNEGGKGEAFRFTNHHNTEMPIDLSYGHHGNKLQEERCAP